MKTYYDGEEREILKIEHWQFHQQFGEIWMVYYIRNGCRGMLPVHATDELDAFNKFPEALALHSKNNEE